MVLGLDEVPVVRFHRLPQLGVRDGVGLLDAVQVFNLLVEALEKYYNYWGQLYNSDSITV